MVAGLGLQDQLKGYAVSKLYRVGLSGSLDSEMCVFEPSWACAACVEQYSCMLPAVLGPYL